MTARACQIDTIPNSDAYENGLSMQVGQTRTVTCKEGFQGGGIITCTPNGFTPLKVECEPLEECEAMNVPNSDKEVEKINGRIGESFTVTCNKGYTGGGETTCQKETKQFSKVTCEVLVCEPTEFKNSNKKLDGSVSGMKYSQTITIECDEGYEGGGVIECQADGKMTRKPCVGPGVTECRELTIPNSIYATSPISGYVTGDQVPVVCNPGYVSNGNTMLCDGYNYKHQVQCLSEYICFGPMRICPRPLSPPPNYSRRSLLFTISFRGNLPANPICELQHGRDKLCKRKLW